MSNQKAKILTKVLGDCRSEGAEYLFKCPKCDHKKQKLSVNFEKNVWKCWVCGYSGKKIYRLVRKYGSNLDVEQWNEYSSDPIPSNFEEYFNSYLNPEEEVEPTVSLPEEFKTLSVVSKYDLEAKKALSFLYGRGLSRHDVVKWKIGFCAEGDFKGRVIVPSFNLEGKCNYFVARNYIDDFYKYKNPKTEKNKIIFNELYVNWASDLIITEGVFDAIVAGNSVPILGTSLDSTHKLFRNVVAHDTPIYLALDDDAQKRSLYIIKEMLKYDIEIWKIDTSGYDDVGSMSKEVFLKRKEEAKLFDLTILLRNQLEMVK